MKVLGAYKIKNIKTELNLQNKSKRKKKLNTTS